MIRIATTPTAWTDTPLDATAIARIGAEAREAGFDGMFGTPDTAAATADAVAEDGPDYAGEVVDLTVLSLTAEEQREALAPVIERMKASGATLLIAREATGATHGTETPLSRRPTLDEGDWDSFGMKLDQIAAFCAEQGITMAFLHHMGTVVQTPEEIDRLMVETQSVNLCFDTAQVYFGGGDPAQVLTRHLPRVAAVRLGNIRVNKLTRARMQDHSYEEAVRSGVFTVPGDRDGSVDFRTCLNLLAASKFDGWLVLSARPGQGDADAAGRQSQGLNAIRALTRQSGLEAA